RPGRRPICLAGTSTSGLSAWRTTCTRTPTAPRCARHLRHSLPERPSMLPVDEIRLNFNPASLVALNVVLGFLMFGIALDTRVADFKRVLRMPGAMAVGIAAQFIVLPAVTFVLTLLLQPGPSIALGMILVACCPPGNVSNILTHRAGGNVALSVSMTAISNALAIVLMPLNFAFWGGMHPTAAPLLRSIALDPLEMAGHIVAIIGIPFVLGILC